MPEPLTREAFLSSLLAQDHATGSPQLKEFRIKLQTLLEHAESTERRYRMARGVAAFITLLVSLSIVPLMHFQMLESGWVMWLFFGALLVSTSISLGLTWLYNGKYVPRVDRARDELQAAIVKDLQQQVAELSRRLMSKSE